MMMLQKHIPSSLLWIYSYTIIGKYCTRLRRHLEFFRSEFQDCRKRSLFWNTKHSKRQFGIRGKDHLERHFPRACPVYVYVFMMNIIIYLRNVNIKAYRVTEGDHAAAVQVVHLSQRTANQQGPSPDPLVKMV
jgi:hypothetical protein